MVCLPNTFAPQNNTQHQHNNNERTVHFFPVPFPLSSHQTLHMYICTYFFKWLGTL